VNKALFIDRDGVLDELVFYPSSGEHEGPRTAADVRIVPGAALALHRAAAGGWLLFIVTNQPSAAKGKTSLDDLVQAQARIITELARDGAHVVKTFQCYHHPEAIVPDLLGPCDCRKPSPYFLLEAARTYDIDLGKSWMVGDQESDIECGRRAGCKVALIENPVSANKRGNAEPDVRCHDISEFISYLGL
jgi:D-glycero-D-manno-heptose 1,7-bisphosphate phosphatase